MKNLDVAKIHLETKNIQGRTLVACKKDDFIKTSKDVGKVNCKRCRQEYEQLRPTKNDI